MPARWTLQSRRVVSDMRSDASDRAIVRSTIDRHVALTGSGVHVSVLCPGWVKTRIFESGRNYPADGAPPPRESPLSLGLT